MPFRTSFSCLWCGATHTVRGREDLEGWAQLCPACIGRAGENEFLRFRLKAALDERGAAARATDPGRPGADLVAADEARAAGSDDWYLRRGPYARGAVHDTAWNAELDAAGRFVDALPFGGEILELAAGTGWWSPLLASKGTLTLTDVAEAPLERARERLLAHGLRAHLHVRDAWAEPDREVDGLFCGFWLGQIPRGRLDGFLGVARRWLRPGGTFGFVDSLADPYSGAADNRAPQDAVEAFHTPDELRAALRRADFADAEVATTGRFFVLGRARRA